MEKIFGTDSTHKIYSSIIADVLIYVGSAAEFALHPQNDWIVYTGKILENPQKRFIETQRASVKIFSLPESSAKKYCEYIRTVHTKVEEKRSKETEKMMKIRNDSYILVGDMIIEYGIRGYEYINRTKLTEQEKSDYFNDIKTMQEWMGIEISDNSYEDFKARRENVIGNILKVNENTDKFFNAYKKDLGRFRYWIFRNFMASFIDKRISEKLNLKRNGFFYIDYLLYPFFQSKWLNHLLLRILIKSQTYNDLMELEEKVAINR